MDAFNGAASAVASGDPKSVANLVLVGCTFFYAGAGAFCLRFLALKPALLPAHAAFVLSQRRKKETGVPCHFFFFFFFFVAVVAKLIVLFRRLRGLRFSL